MLSTHGNRRRVITRRREGGLYFNNSLSTSDSQIQNNDGLEILEYYDAGDFAIYYCSLFKKIKNMYLRDFVSSKDWPNTDRSLEYFSTAFFHLDVALYALSRSQ